MIYIRMEMWPGGDENRKRILQEGIIHNTGGTESAGEYEYLFSKRGGFRATIDMLRRADVKNILRRGNITGFPRKRLYAHDLLFRALRLAFGERNKE